MTYAAVNYAYFKLVMCMELQKRRKLIEEGVLVDDSPKSPKTEETRLVSKTEMMDGLLAKDYGTAIQNEEPVVAITDPAGKEKSDEAEKEILDKDTLEDNVGVIVDKIRITVDNGGIPRDNSGDNTSTTVGTEEDYCELDEGEETELYSKENKNKKQVTKKKGEEKILLYFDSVLSPTFYLV